MWALRFVDGRRHQGSSSMSSLVTCSAPFSDAQEEARMLRGLLLRVFSFTAVICACRRSHTAERAFQRFVEGRLLKRQPGVTSFTVAIYAA